MTREPHRQEDVEDVILDALAHGRTMTTVEVTKAVKGRLNLSPADMQKANKRDNEAKIDQIIANALQSRRNLCRNSLIERCAVGEFRITAAGQAYLSDRDARVVRARKMLDDLFPDAEWD